MGLVPGAAPQASAAEPSIKQFDLPAAPAEKSLKRFSEQAGVELVFPTDVVANVRTHAVLGRMTPEQALETMLEGTGLRAARDEKTGALTISRAAPPARASDSATLKKKPL